MIRLFHSFTSTSLSPASHAGGRNLTKSRAYKLSAAVCAWYALYVGCVRSLTSGSAEGSSGGGRMFAVHGLFYRVSG